MTVSIFWLAIREKDPSLDLGSLRYWFSSWLTSRFIVALLPLIVWYCKKNNVPQIIAMEMVAKAIRRLVLVSLANFFLSA